MAKHRDMILAIRQWKEETGNTDIDMHKVAEFAHRRLGWSLPKQPEPIDLLARQFSRSAREDVRRDSETGKPYRGFHAIKVVQGDQQFTFWVDIDEATRKKMLISATQRREQMVGDGLQLKRDVEHWNRVHEDEEPIQMEMDLSYDILWRENSPEEDDEE